MIATCPVPIPTWTFKSSAARQVSKTGVYAGYIPKMKGLSFRSRMVSITWVNVCAEASGVFFVQGPGR